MTGFVETGARRHVAANPGAYLAPDRDPPYPHGFGELPEELGGEEAIRRYLARPPTIYVGTDDTGRENLDSTDDAERQGRNRVERGRNVFAAAHKLAMAKGYEFRWKLVEAPGVGHVWPMYCQSWYRNYNTPQSRYLNLGLRVVMEVDPTEK